MKNLILLSVFFTLLALVSCNQSSKKAVDEQNKEIKTADKTAVRQNHMELVDHGWMNPYFEAYKVVHHLDYLKDLHDNSTKGLNKLYHTRELADHTFDVITPALDHIYSKAIIDIRTEPQIINAPEVSGRYSSVMLTDLEGGVIYYAVREQGEIMVVSNDYKGEIPAGIDKVVKSNSDFVHFFIRTQVFDNSDLKNATAIQDKWSISGLTGKESLPFEAPPKDAHWKEKAIYAYENSRRFDINKSLIESIYELDDPDGKKYDEAYQYLIDKANAGYAVDSEGVFEPIDDPNGSKDILTRAIGIYIGHLGLPGNAALYEAITTWPDGKRLTGDKPFILTIPYEPGVEEFWSFTRYDGKTRLPIKGHLDVYNAYNTKPDENGNITITFSAENPKDGTYWMYAPATGYYFIARYYGPTEKLKGNTASASIQ